MALIFLSCEKNDLPKITSEGKNTFGMLVNGENWIPQMSGIIHLEEGPINVHYDKSKYYLSIRALNLKKNEQVYFYFHDIIKPGNYHFSYRNKLPIDPSFTCVDSTRFEINNVCNNSFKLRNIDESSLILTKLDTINKIVSGTFSIRLFNSENIMIDINNGRFDLTY